MTPQSPSDFPNVQCGDHVDSSTSHVLKDKVGVCWYGSGMPSDMTQPYL
jgi:hypothetical protein